MVYEVCRDECYYAWKGSKVYLDGKEIHHPVEITRADLVIRLATYNYLFHPFPDMVGVQVYFLLQRFADEYLDFFTIAFVGIRKINIYS